MHFPRTLSRVKMVKGSREGRGLVLYTDGASRGNPGPAGAGALILDEDGATVAEKAVYLGEATNNQAEYQALLIGLDAAAMLSPSQLTVRMDSELIVKQLNGQYRVRHRDLVPLHGRARDLMQRFAEIHVVHIPREENARADWLANQAIDNRS
jgi:ribonuclease HI